MSRYVAIRKRSYLRRPPERKGGKPAGDASNSALPKWGVVKHHVPPFGVRFGVLLAEASRPF